MLYEFNIFKKKIGYILQIVYQSAHIDAQIHNIGSHVCSFAKNVVQNAFVFLLELMGTSKLALVTIIGRLREEVLNVLKI